MEWTTEAQMMGCDGGVIQPEPEEWIPPECYIGIGPERILLCTF